jgi:hypothetical protein
MRGIPRPQAVPRSTTVHRSRFPRSPVQNSACLQVRRQPQVTASRCALDDLIGLVLRDYADNGKAAAQRIREYRAHLVEHFGKRRSGRDLTAREIDRYKDRRLKEEIAPATINRELACVRRAFRLGRERGLVAPNEVPVISLFSEQNVRTHGIS